MIAWIKGTVLEITEKSLLIATHSVAYDILIGEEKIKDYQQHQEVSFFIFSLLKDKWFEFYGFASLKQKELFELLITVNGLGPKSAHKIIQCYAIEQIVEAIINKESFLFEKIAGIGKKTAAKIGIDLEKKIVKVKTSVDSLPSNEPVMRNLFSALQNMGYGDRNILQVIQKTIQLDNQDLNFNLLLKSCLKQLMKK